MAKNTLMHTLNFMIKFFRFNINQVTFIELKNKLGIKTWLMAGFSALSLLYACSDDENTAGLEIHPPNDAISIEHRDSAVVKAYTYENENNIVVASSYASVLLGYCNDPVLGQFQNNFITKVGITTTSEIYDSVIVIADSLILYLDFYASDGDTTMPQEINIYELELNSDINNLQGVELDNQTLDGYYNPNEPLTTFTLQPRTSWYNDTVSRSPIRIDLSDKQDLIERLLTREIVINTDSLIYPYQDVTVFNEHLLNGLYFEAVKNNESGSVAVINIDSTRMAMYYRAIGDATTDTLTYVYPIATQSKANLYYRTFNEALVYNKMYTNIEMSVEDTSIYLKNNNAFYTRIVIDDIGEWDPLVSINKASIFLECEEQIDSDTLFKPIESIVAYREIGSDKYLLAKHNDQEGGPAPIYYNSTKRGYEIVITGEMQDMIKEEESSIMLYVRSNENHFSSRRTILNSPLKENNPMKFIVTYSIYQ